MPYITSSIIIQILGVVIPKLQEWQDQGAVGQRKITQWTRYLDHRDRPAPSHRPHLPLRPGRRPVFFGGGNAPNVVLLPGSPLPRVLLVIATSPPARCC